MEEWFERRSYDHSRFADLDALARSKRELGVSVSVVLPTREVAPARSARSSTRSARSTSAPLVDQLLVVDAGSADGSAEIAARHGAEVYRRERAAAAASAPCIGKGDAMWRALSVARGDLVMYLDSDTTDFGRHFVYGLLGPAADGPGAPVREGCLQPSLAERRGRSRSTAAAASPS